MLHVLSIDQKYLSFVDLSRQKGEITLQQLHAVEPQSPDTSVLKVTVQITEILDK